MSITNNIRRIEDVDFLLAWLEQPFASKKYIFQILVELHNVEKDKQKRAFLRAKVFSEMQASLEDLGMLLTAMREQHQEIVTTKKYTTSFLTRLLKIRTDLDWIDELLKYVSHLDVNSLVKQLGLPEISISPQVWGAKPSSWSKEFRKINSYLGVIKAHISNERRIGRRLGNKVRHFGFFAPTDPDGVEVWLDPLTEEKTIQEKNQIIRWRLPDVVEVDIEAFTVSRYLIEKLINTYIFVYPKGNSFSQKV